MFEGRDSSSMSPGGKYWSIYLFRFFNALTAQIMLGAPLVIYVKELGANSTMLGILSSFAPLMSLIEPRAAGLIPYLGYKRLVLVSAGFYSLSAAALAATAVLFTGGHLTKLFLLAIWLCLFNLARYAASTAFIPWIAAIIPLTRLGFFVSINQLFKHSGNLCALLISASVIFWHVSEQGFAWIFLIGAIGGAMSFVCVQRIPKVKKLDVIKRSSQVISKKAMLTQGPFASILVLTLAMVSVTGCLEIFTIEFLRDVPKFNVHIVMYLSGLVFAAAILSLPTLGHVVDRVGSKPVMAFAISLYCIVLSGWFLVAANVLPSHIGIIGILMFFTGLAQSNYIMANERLVIATAPEIGRNHLLAFFSIAISCGLSAAFIIWGILLDLFHYIEISFGTVRFCRHSYYFLAMLILSLVSLVLLRRIKEDREGVDRLEGGDCK